MLAAIDYQAPDLVLLDHGTGSRRVIEMLEQRTPAPGVIVLTGGPPQVPIPGA